MGDSEWGFLLDENIDRDTATQLRDHGYRAELVVDVLEPGADDVRDLLPYARTEDLVIVTKDVSDFARLSLADHEGLILVFNDRLTGYELVSGILSIVEAYPTRDDLRHREILDQWVR